MPLCILTGASRGLGLALVQQLQAEQPAVQLIEFSRSAPHAFSVQADLSDPQALHHQVMRALAGVSAPSDELLIIHNAGAIEPIGPLGAQDSTALLANLHTNFASGVAFMAAVVTRYQGAASARKRILNISSGAALRPIAGWSHYCAAKAGMEHFVRTLALEQQAQAQPFVAINVNPGVMDTGMQASIRAAQPERFPDHALFVQRHAQGALQAPAAVATRVLALARRHDLVSGERYDASASRTGS
jgi:benzil reductase ((S)-benzoin forming)